MIDAAEQSASPSPSRDALLAALLPVALLLPFINKAIHIDDTVYILIAQHIVQSPLDYFGFQMNWTGEVTWVYQFNKNPPGLSYYLAAWGVVFGWSEVSMHAAMLVPTALASLGIFRLAQRLCGRPLLTTALAVCTPGFLVSCSNVMCEPPMLACYVWAIVWWLRGMDSGSARMLGAGALLIGVGTLVKFVTFTALPLLVAYTIWKERRVSAKLLWFLLPIAMLLLYDAASWLLYDKSFMRDIVQYSAFHTSRSSRGPMAATTLVTFAYVGGIFLPALAFAIWSESWRMLRTIAGITAIFLAYIFLRSGVDNSYAMYGDDGVLWGFVAQQTVFTVAGVYVFVLGAIQFAKHRTAESALLCLLVGGIFVFGGFVNWTINARSLLPMVPAVAILVVQRLESLDEVRFDRVGGWAVGIVAVLLGLAVCYGDYRYAGTSRAFAEDVRGKLQSSDGTVWYDGHLGFQWYMHEAGYRALDFAPANEAEGEDKFFNTSRIVLETVPAGDAVILWQNNALLAEIPEERLGAHQEFAYAGAAWISINDELTLAGFYEKRTALLPYRFGPAPPQEFRVYWLR